MVFKFTFSGTEYTVGMAAGVGGWTLIDQLPAGTDGVIIQATIDFVVALGGGKVLIGIGDYAILATITAEPGIYIIGSGRVGPETGATTGGTTLVGANGINMFEFNVGGAKLFSGGIRDLTITLDAATMGIIVDNLLEFQIDCLHIRQGANTYENAIELRNDSYYASIRNTFIHDFTVYGVRVLSNMVLLDGLWIEQNENGSAFILIQGCSETKIVNSKLETHSTGLINHIEIEDGYRIIIANNKISGGYGTGTFGIYVSETGAGLSYEIIINGNIFDREKGSHITFWEAGDTSVISDNTFIDGGGEGGDLVPIFKFRTVYRLIFSNNNLDSSNDFATHGILAENPYSMIIAGNYLSHDGTMPTIELSGTSSVANIVNNIINCTVSTYALNAGNNVLRVMITYNNIITGGLRVASVGSLALHNRVEGTIVILDGVILATIPITLVQGTTFISTAGQAWGWEINADTEFALGIGWLPLEVQQVVRIRVIGVALAAPGAGDYMRIQITGDGGTFGEGFSTEPIDVVDKNNNATDPQVDEPIQWIFTPTDDADIGHLLGGDRLQIKVLHEGAGNGDAQTNAIVDTIQVEYV